MKVTLGTNTKIGATIWGPISKHTVQKLRDHWTAMAAAEEDHIV